MRLVAIILAVGCGSTVNNVARGPSPEELQASTTTMLSTGARIALAFEEASVRSVDRAEAPDWKA